MSTHRTAVFLLLAALGPGLATLAVAGEEPAGSIEGRVTLENGSGVGGVTVSVAELSAERLTEASGEFAFRQVPPGVYTLSFTLGRNRLQLADVRVEAGRATALHPAVDWDFVFSETLTVSSASRRRERIVGAPAAVTTIPPEEVEREAATGQLPKLLEFTPGAELTQGNLYDFNLNVRGGNDPFNRRLLTLIDGRDTSIPTLGSQEWAATWYPLDDLASVELVRGPASALYGADAFNGVLNILTKPPHLSRGGTARFTFGELATSKIDFRYATGLGSGWYLKTLGGYTASDDFFRPRIQSVEYSRPCAFPGQYDCLPLEATAPPLDRNRIAYGSLRADKHLGDDKTLVVEGGTAAFEGPVQVTEFGRLQVLDVGRPWARVNFSIPHWNVLGYYNGRDGDAHVFLNQNYPFTTSEERWSLEVQGNADFAGGRGFVVGGAAVMSESIDSADRRGVQTVTYRRRTEDFEALFGQVEYRFTDRLKSVLALRWDDSSLHGAELSPRASLVWAVRPDHTLRLTAGQAFLRPSYTQYFLHLPVAPPVDLTMLEAAFCQPFGVDCGFGDPVAIRSGGNRSLEVEEISSFELGYSGVVGNRTFVTLDYFNNQIENFISDFIPFVQPWRGRLHGNYPPYAPPPELPPPVALALVEALSTLPPELAAILSMGPDGVPAFVLLSVRNFGRLDTQGVELGLTRQLGRDWSLDLGYTWFDFEVKGRIPEDPALPNTAEHKVYLALTYVGDRLDAALRYRWVDDFRWSAGFYRGEVASYGVTDLTANLSLAKVWRVGLDISNLFDESHYEFFGSDLLGRRALVSVSYAF